MALRVLLADESTTIKKVMQLALQDFAVEVKSVHSGVDVLEVARHFEPDIVFADVLLQKKNGYEVAGELKNDPESRHIPVVLMWSSFMELDEKLAQISNADRRLEKPFDVESLRQLVLELVPKTRSQRLAHFLKFPDSFTEPLKAEEKARAETPPPPPPMPQAVAPSPSLVPPLRPNALETQPDEITMRVRRPDVGEPSAPPPSSWSMESFADLGQFAEQEAPEPRLLKTAPPAPTPPLRNAPVQQGQGAEHAADDDDEVFTEMRLGNNGPAPRATVPLRTDEQPAKPLVDDRDPWSHQDLSRFMIDLPENGDEIALEVESDDVEIEESPAPWPPISQNAGEEGQHLELEMDDLRENEAAPIESPLSLTDFTSAHSAARPTGPAAGRPTPAAAVPRMNREDLEEIIRAQSHDMILDIVRKIVPDLATTLIREELHRLLSEENEPGLGTRSSSTDRKRENLP